MNRVLLWALAVLFVLSGLASAQEQGPPTTVVQQGDTFPAALGYAAIALAGTVWTAMSGVLLHLWNRMGKESKDHSEAMEVKDKAHVAALAEKDRELREIQEARRVESEKLLREQKDIFAEVMVTTSKMGTAFDENRMATQRLQELIEGLTEYMEQLIEQQEE